MIIYMEPTINLIANQNGIEVAKKIADVGELKQINETKYIKINHE